MSHLSMQPLHMFSPAVLTPHHAHFFLTDKNLGNVKTDIFALGLTMYHIITGHRPSPQYDTIDNEAKFEELYRSGQFPPLMQEVV